MATNFDRVQSTEMQTRKKGYSFYQLFIIQQLLEQLAQKEMFFDFENEEVYSIYQSNFE
jgi:hypothetical protein